MNVLNQVEKAGGRGVYGWKILEFPGLFIQAIHHAIWVDTRHRLFDVTPDIRRWKQHVFCPDESIKFSGAPVSVVRPLTTNISGLAEVDEALEINNILTEMRIRDALSNGMLPPPDNQNPTVNELSNRALAVLTLAELKVRKK